MTRITLLLCFALTACDPDGNGRPATEPTGVDDITAPVVAIDPATPGSGDDLAALIQVPSETTADGTVSYQFSWYRDGEELTDLVGLETVPAEHTAVGEAWTLEVTAALDELSSDIASDTVSIANGAPSVQLSLSPSQPNTDDDIEAHVTTDDPDDEALELSYAWYLEGAATDQAESLLPAEATQRDEQWLLQVTATDPSGASAEAWAEVDIANSAPEVLGAVISPQPFSVSDQPLCLAVGFEDPDGDQPENLFAWFADGLVLGDATGEELDTSLVVRGQLVRCELTASDGELAGNTVSSTEVEVDNAAPGAPEVAIFPTDPSAGATLEAIVVTNAEDPDGDTLSYTPSWTVDGSFYGEDITVPGLDVQAGQVWELWVTASDGELSGEAGTASVTIAN